MISITKKGTDYLLEVKQKKPLEDLNLKFDSWNKLVFWLDKECEKHFENIKPIGATELFMRN